MSNEPIIIQGGMGAGVSSWRLARAVSQQGQLGVVSGTALDQILARRLQDGDPGGHMRHAFDHFPLTEMGERIWQKYYIRGGKPVAQSYLRLPMHSNDDAHELIELCIASNFVEVFLAREGHTHPVGINYLEKIQIPHLPSIYGAMLAGVGYILMGAGIPLKIPGVLDLFVQHKPATYPLHVTGTLVNDVTNLVFDPAEFTMGGLPRLTRPKFLAIIASNALATTFRKKANGKVDGFVIEGPTAGGYNAPPRGKLQLNANGEPIYGERDQVDIKEIRASGLPFWLAGGYGTPEKLRTAIAAGATGIQVGTAFAFCNESALDEDYKQALLYKALKGTARIFTDPLASPTGFPLKVAQLENTISEGAVYQDRPRICDLGFLREAYRTPKGTIDFRCPAEPETIYLSKGGTSQQTQGRKCICNALIANIGQPQVRAGGYIEKPLVTSGDDLTQLARLLPPNELRYSAANVISSLLRGRQ